MNLTNLDYEEAIVKVRKKCGGEYNLDRSRNEHGLRGSCTKEWVEDCAGEMQQSLRGLFSAGTRENAS